MYLMALVWLIPLLWMVRTAFLPQSVAIGLSATAAPTLENFQDVLSAAPFNTYYLNTILIVVGTLAVQIFFITLAGYAFARLDFFGKNVLFTLFMAQLMITPDVLIFPMYQLMTDFGLVNTLPGIMLPFFASAMGIFLMRQNLRTLPAELEEAAKMEGCSTWKIIWSVYAPLLKPTYAAFGLISVSYHWNDFLWPLVMINDVNKRPLTLGLAVFAQAYETGAQWGDICAATCLVVAPLLLIFLFFQRQFIESFAKSGMK
ncbi:carbohydrate ABC transporter permease [Caproicibacter fermentans]|uniref:Carbohydrate ABC transporter permease n=2 Tax=Caproicibacter fermentans TaxID=2576756 RepID=A0A7G8TGE1_9FIRM|nr:carbohydrate ABC transporter permease [Caproicibacter fermentans]